MASPANPLLGSWPSTAGVNVPGQPPQIGTPPAANPDQGNKSSAANLAKTTNVQNLQTGNLRNQLIPLFSNEMTGLAGPASQFFGQLTNLGSPFYQQKQQQSFTQGVQQEQNQGAQSREQLQAAGAGYTPSGAAAAMFGGEAQAGAGNQAELFLNNLFQNEQLQLAGATGLSQLAGLFNPSGLFGQTGYNNPPQSSGFLANLAGVTGAISNIFGGGSNSAFSGIPGT